MNEVLFIAWGTGGSEIYKEIFNLKGLDFKYSTISASPYSKKILPNASQMDEDDVFRLIIRTSPELVITERSNGTDFHNKLTDICKAKGSKTLAITDFYFPKVADYSRLFKPKPDYVTSVSKASTRELKRLGFMEDQIYMLGNPSYKKLEKIEYHPKYSKIPRVIYVSQGGGVNLYHYSNLDTFTEFYKHLEYEFENFSIDIKLHPMELDYKDKWVRSIEHLKNINILNHIPGDEFMFNNLNNYDIMIGCYSTMQIQAQLIGVPTIYSRDDIKYKLKQYKKRILGKDRNEYVFVPSKTEIEMVLNDVYRKAVKKEWVLWD